MTCEAGSKAFYARGANGIIHGCAHSYPTDLGNMFKNEFSPKTTAVKCGLDHCICDFNYYTGTVPALDDSEAFDKVTSGKFQPVEFEEFQEWIGQSNVQSMINLSPIIGKTLIDRSEVFLENLYHSTLINI